MLDALVEAEPEIQKGVESLANTINPNPPTTTPQTPQQPQGLPTESTPTPQQPSPPSLQSGGLQPRLNVQNDINNDVGNNLQHSENLAPQQNTALTTAPQNVGQQQGNQGFLGRLAPMISKIGTGLGLGINSGSITGALNNPLQTIGSKLSSFIAPHLQNLQNKISNVISPLKNYDFTQHAQNISGQLNNFRQLGQKYINPSNLTSNFSAPNLPSKIDGFLRNPGNKIIDNGGQIPPPTHLRSLALRSVPQYNPNVESLEFQKKMYALQGTLGTWNSTYIKGSTFYPEDFPYHYNEVGLNQSQIQDTNLNQTSMQDFQGNVTTGTIQGRQPLFDRSTDPRSVHTQGIFFIFFSFSSHESI